MPPTERRQQTLAGVILITGVVMLSSVYLIVKAAEALRAVR
jgi:hypothetical protein